MDVFVTCIYNNLYNTKFGGRNVRDPRYRESLVAIAKTGVPIYCYTSPNDYPALDRYFNSFGITNIKLIVLDLADIPFHKDIQRIKDANPEIYTDFFWTQRCVEIMWGKILMIERTLIQNPDIENLFWIDAGLLHNDAICFPKYAIADAPSTPEIGLSLFNEDFIPKLKKYIDNKVLLVVHEQPHNKPIAEKYNTNQYNNIHHCVVGGFFGGNRDGMLYLTKAFFEKMDKIIADNIVCSEEGIITGAYIDNPEIFKLFGFDSWYHEGWGDWHNPTLRNFSNVFDEITNNNILEDNMIICTLAYGEKYREISKKLIDSFLQFSQGYKLVLFTDDVDFYDQYTDERLIFKVVNIRPHVGEFIYGTKCKVVAETHKMFETFDKILYVDGDCYFTNTITSSIYDGIKNGLNAVLGSNTDKLSNNLIIQKVNQLIRKPAENDLRQFRECALMFKIEDKYTFKKFLCQWQFISDEIAVKKLVNSAEYIDISLAAKRANYPINDIWTGEMLNLRGSIFTIVLGAPCAAVH
jgi:hypothetical protein